MILAQEYGEIVARCEVCRKVVVLDSPAFKDYQTAKTGYVLTGWWEQDGNKWKLRKGQLELLNRNGQITVTRRTEPVKK